jgi:hypothetical protein
MTDDELNKRLDRIEQLADSARSHAMEKGHFIIIVLLLILLTKHC